MAQYIDKSALVAEIEKRLEALANTSAEDNRVFAAIIGAQHYELIKLAQYINTLEVKEVDLEKEIQSWIEDNSVNGYYREDVYETAKHFFELGFKSQKGE